MDYFNDLLAVFLSLNRVKILAVFGRVREISEIHKKYLHLFSESEWRSYRFGTTWGWVINDRIFILGRAISLSHCSLKNMSSPLNLVPERTSDVINEWNFSESWDRLTPLINCFLNTTIIWLQKTYLIKIIFYRFHNKKNPFHPKQGHLQLTDVSVKTSELKMASVGESYFQE